MGTCELCPLGKYQSVAGEAECNRCPVGSLCVRGSSTPQACSDGQCADPRVLSAVGYLRDLDDCITCPAGSWCSAGYTFPCLTGRYNPYTSADNASACIECPPKSTTRDVGSSVVTQCECQSRYYNNATINGGVSCARCPVGTTCEGLGSNPANLHVRRGFYRLSNTSVSAYRCPDAGVNCTSASECNESTSGCRGSSRSSLCEPSLKGPFCKLCAERSDGERVYYRSARAADERGPGMIAHCELCSASLGVWGTLVIGFGLTLLALLLLATALLVWVYCVDIEIKARLTELREYFTLRNKLKTLIGFYQIVVNSGRVYEVQMPPQVSEFLATVAIPLNILNPFSLETVSLECIGLGGYVSELLFITITPLVIVALLIMGFAAIIVARHKPLYMSSVLLGVDDGVDSHGGVLPYLIMVFFLVYPSVTFEAFEVFACYDFGDSRSYLIADVSIECNSLEHHDAFFLAALAILIYSVGIPLLFVMLLYRARTAIERSRPTRLSMSIAFLYKECVHTHRCTTSHPPLLC